MAKEKLSFRLNNSQKTYSFNWRPIKYLNIWKISLKEFLGVKFILIKSLFGFCFFVWKKTNFKSRKGNQRKFQRKIGFAGLRRPISVFSLRMTLQKRFEQTKIPYRFEFDWEKLSKQRKIIEAKDLEFQWSRLSDKISTSERNFGGHWSIKKFIRNIFGKLSKQLEFVPEL